MGHYACNMRPEWFAPDERAKPKGCTHREIVTYVTLNDGAHSWHCRDCKVTFAPKKAKKK